LPQVLDEQLSANLAFGWVQRESHRIAISNRAPKVILVTFLGRPHQLLQPPCIFSLFHLPENFARVLEVGMGSGLNRKHLYFDVIVAGIEVDLSLVLIFDLSDLHKHEDSLLLSSLLKLSVLFLH
jgi:hypothetical protein